MSVSNALYPCLQRAMVERPAGYHVYCMVDLAALTHTGTVAQMHAHIRSNGGVSLLRDERPEALHATPWLVCMGDGDMSVWVSRTCGWAMQGPAVTWVVSPLSLPDLAERLWRRTEAELPEHYPVLLRYFDPRVLPELLQTLPPSQRERFLALGSEWLYPDREQRLQRIALSDPKDSDDFEGPLRLDAQQFSQLLCAAEIDQVMPELARAAPVEFMALSVTQRLNLTRDCLSLASTWGVDGLADKVMVGVLSLKLGNEFHRLPNWAPWIHALTQQRMSFLQVIERATQGEM
ncbi:DUF4123 domain-containing protein [Aquabacterium sp.]|uniref:DUF4123 domain-containing protein n=1 Tax=Aquabacterium sp. TaxID=1872578 RepID=UPI0035B16CCF